jgi:hypothetical protein
LLFVLSLVIRLAPGHRKSRQRAPLLLRGPDYPRLRKAKNSAI